MAATRTLAELLDDLCELAAWETRGQSDLVRDLAVEAAQELCLQALEGDSRLLERSRGYLRQCLRHAIRDELRRVARHREFARAPAAAPWLRGTSALEPGIFALTSESELAEIAAQAIRDAASANPDYVEAWLARERWRLEKEGGPERVRAFEEMLGISLGSHSGTRSLAQARGRSHGTAANAAFRGWALIRRRFLERLRERLKVPLDGSTAEML